MPGKRKGADTESENASRRHGEGKLSSAACRAEYDPLLAVWVAY
jgi:hypothetical protein